ncbi:amidohydrolase family protein [Aurantiacibacter hainanensis]|uniref:amidohydrolase family protein n=1 Tax=Aurantiacibacter hainanensis TaxID=3076114 RepID=UPI0030C6C04C
MHKTLSAVAAFLVALSLSCPAAAQDGERTRSYTGPVIDVHLHAAGAQDNGPAPNAVCPGLAADLRYTGSPPWPAEMTRIAQNPTCADPIRGPATDAEVREQTIAQLEEHDAIAILSSRQDDFAQWAAAAPGLFLRGHSFNLTWEDAPTVAELADAYDRGEFQVLAEVTNQYGGVLADDPAFAAYWDMAAAKGIPVGLHLGPGPPGAPALYPEFRVQSPLAIEEVLRTRPNLRVYLMHAGWPFVDDLKAMLYLYPQLNVDTGVLQLAATRAEYHAFLKELVDAGFVDRIMFGSDQMNWPGMIGEGIDAINDAPFLTHEQKRAILHDNAARFFAPELEAFRSGE